MNISLYNYYHQFKNKYKISSQLIRAVTENWFNENMYCPFCTAEDIKGFKNNYPVADFYCDNCGEEFQLKSKKNSLGNVITDGEFHKMITSIYSKKNPNFFLELFSKYRTYNKFNSGS